MRHTLLRMRHTLLQMWMHHTLRMRHTLLRMLPHTLQMLMLMRMRHILLLMLLLMLLLSLRRMRWSLRQLLRTLLLQCQSRMMRIRIAECPALPSLPSPEPRSVRS